MRPTAALYLTSRRTYNRWLDLRGRLAGYCMADTWRVDPGNGPGYAGYAHWRCWKRRHPATEEHRFNNYVWHTGERTVYVPTGVQGVQPRWGKHSLIVPRRRARMILRYCERLVQERRRTREGAA